MKKVFIIEDEVPLQEMWRKILGEKVEIVSAFSIEEAEEKFAANPDIDAVILDACVSGEVLNTVPLAKKIRATFSGPIIASSSVAQFNEQLVEAGCDHQCHKFAVPRTLCAILGL